MSEPSRRDVLASGALAAGGLLVGARAVSDTAHASQTPPAAEPGPPKADALPAFRFPLEAQPAKTGEGGTAREASARECPVSTGIAGVSMRLAAGTLRELHWHANAAEWAYVISGNCRVTIYSPSGKAETLDFGPGDVWYFPRGHGHSIQGIGPGDCHFILLFDNGYFSEFATFSFSDWIGHTPHEVLTKNLKLPESTLAKLPTKEVYFAKGPVGPAPVRPRRGPPPVHKYRLGHQTPNRFNGGDLRLVSSREFPISKTITGATMTLEPGALREMHWHPNADEWQYVLEGKMRMTVFASLGRASTVELGPGDIGYVPQGFGHYLENIGDTNCRLLLAFNNGTYQEIGISGWIASNPRQLVATNLEVSEDLLKGLPERETFIDK